ncbi:MAG TPA: nucleoside/nucleotide kinase family protein [Jiangellaceae bacterium]|nr:nucleoside/nucleotide kinase family protein [Jiangellaceae bacterium]
MNHPERLRLEEVVGLATELIVAGRRTILGVTGAPGAGKSLLAEAIVTAFPDSTRVVGMDGFHLAQAELHRLGRGDRKGAIDTFDADGYIALLRRLHTPDTTTVYAPRFDRSLEEPIGSAVPVPADVPLVVTEGNYLLVPDAPWNEVRELLDMCWYLEPGENVRTQRLIARHQSFGRAPHEAYQRAWGSDQRNAELVASTRERADRVLTITTTSLTPATPAAPHRRR